MNWTELIKSELEAASKSTKGLIDLVDEDTLDWKPSTENNWMTAGQLLCHIANASGVCFRGFITGDWGFPSGADLSELTPEDMLPPAEKLPTVSSLAEAKESVAKDIDLAYDMLAQCSEEDLASKTVAAPWDPTEKNLGNHLLNMVTHLNQHKYQLFYYLKLQGKPVNTHNLW